MIIINIIAQIIGLIAFIIFVSSVQMKNKNKLLICQLIANFFYAVQYLLLNSITTAIMNLVSVLRTYVFFRYFQKKKKIPLIYLILFCLLIIFIGIVTYKNLLSIIPIIITLAYTISTYFDNMKIIRITFILCACLWIYFNIKVGAYTSLIGNLFEITSGVIALIKFNKKK